MFFFFFNDTATTEIYTLSLHDALPICQREQTVNLPRLALRRFESFPHHFVARGRSSVGRASAFQAEGHGFEPRRPLCTKNARVAQSVERVLGKDEVTGSIPVASSAL